MLERMTKYDMSPCGTILQMKWAEGEGPTLDEGLFLFVPIGFKLSGYRFVGERFVYARADLVLSEPQACSSPSAR